MKTANLDSLKLTATPDIPYKDRMSPAGCAMKRLLDIVCAAGSMIVFSPLMCWIFLRIRREMGGHVIFSQERIGMNGKPFILYKFRTMVEHAEEDGTPQLCHKGDSRLTPLGKYLREHHLDELPQLYNVLRGDMSFVGPRPERKYYIDQIIEVDPEYKYLYQVRPGLFSEATLNNGYTDTIEKMVTRLRMDLDYLGRHTLWSDTKIIILTAFSIISGKKF